jgi:hypothetical protein
MVIKPEEYEKIKRMYLNGLLPVIVIAKRFNVTRAAIYKVLGKAGVDTGKHGKIELICLHCGKEYSLHRFEIRKLRERYKYCGKRCFAKACSTPPSESA